MFPWSLAWPGPVSRLSVCQTKLTDIRQPSESSLLIGQRRSVLASDWLNWVLACPWPLHHSVRAMSWPGVVPGHRLTQNVIKIIENVTLRQHNIQECYPPLNIASPLWSFPHAGWWGSPPLWADLLTVWWSASIISSTISPNTSHHILSLSSLNKISQ